MPSSSPPTSALSIFDIKAGATATIRGFNVQHLDAAHQWLQAIDTDREIHCETWDDVSNYSPTLTERRFRQIKSYRSTALSQNHSAVRHSIYLFYRNYIQFRGEACTFTFVLDGEFRTSDALLSSWAASNVPPTNSGAEAFLKACVLEGLNDLKTRRLAACRGDQTEEARVKAEYDRELATAEAEDYTLFASAVQFEQDPAEVDQRIQFLQELVRPHTVLPPDLAVARVFQEAALRAGSSNATERILTSAMLRTILAESERAVLDNLEGDYLGRLLLKEMQSQRELLECVYRQVESLPDIIRTSQGVSTSLLFDEPLSRQLSGPVSPDPGYYRGKNAGWRHILAGQDVPRPKLTEEIFRRLAGPNRNCILRSESGQGKTTLMYRIAYDYRNLFRVIEIHHADYSQPHRAVYAAQMLRQMPGRILLLMDDITRFAGWQRLLDEVLKLEHVYLLGTCRSDEWTSRNLHGLESILELLTPTLDYGTARGIFQALKGAGILAPGVTLQDAWRGSHRRLLEYVTLLTQGTHLEALLSTQLNQLDAEPEPLLTRKILRFVTTAHMIGQTLSYDVLERLAGDEAGKLELILSRLTGEYLEKDRRGAYGGVHELRSQIISSLLHLHVPVRNTLRAIFEAMEPSGRLDLAESIQLSLPDQVTALHDQILREAADLSGEEATRWLGIIADRLDPVQQQDLTAKLRLRLEELQGKDALNWLIELADDSPGLAKATLEPYSARALLDKLANKPIGAWRAQALIELTPVAAHLSASLARFLEDHLPADEQFEQFPLDRSQRAFTIKCACLAFVDSQLGNYPLESLLQRYARIRPFDSHVDVYRTLRSWEGKGSLPSGRAELVETEILEKFGQWFPSPFAQMAAWEMVDQLVPDLASRLDDTYRIWDRYHEVRALEYEQSLQDSDNWPPAQPEYRPEDAGAIEATAAEGPVDGAEKFLKVMALSNDPAEIITEVSDTTLSLIAGPAVPAVTSVAVLKEIFRLAPERFRAVATKLGLDPDLLSVRWGLEP